MKKNILILLILFSNFIFANSIEFNSNNKSFKNVKADTANIVFSIKTKSKNREDAEKINNKKLDKFIKEIKKFNVDNIVTKNSNYNTIVNKVGDPIKIYTNTISFYTSIRKEEYKSIMDKLAKENINGYTLKTSDNGDLIFILTENGGIEEENILKIDKKLKKIEKIINNDIYLFDSNKSFYDKYNEEKNYEVVNNVLLRLKDLSKLNDLLDIANKNEIYLEGQIDYTVSNLRDIYIELYKKSLDEAKNKAKLLFDKEYKIKNIKDITENRRIDYNYVQSQNINLIRLESKAMPKRLENVDKKPNLEIPLVYIENDLYVSLILDNGKKEEETFGDFNIKSNIVKKIIPNIAEINFDITTLSENSIKDANNKNVIALNKIKDIFKLANIKYKNMQNINYSTENFYKYIVENKNSNIKNLNKSKIYVDVKGITSKDYIDIVSKYNINKDKNYKYFVLEIEEIGEDTKESYKKVQNKLEELKNSHPRATFEISKINNEKINNDQKEEKKVKMYSVTNNLKFEIDDINKLSLIISIFRELGLTQNINYGVSNIENYYKDLYSTVKKEIGDKISALENTEYAKVINIKKVSEINNNLTKYFDNDNYYLYNRRNEVINLDKSNKEILKEAYDNLENLYIQDYDAYLTIDINMGIK